MYLWHFTQGHKHSLHEYAPSYHVRGPAVCFIESELRLSMYNPHKHIHFQRLMSNDKIAPGVDPTTSELLKP